jgi:glycosyltransferase involved in cell wall biosynthesis
MRILFVVPYPPSYIRTRSYHLIQQLTALGHQVTVLTLWSDAAEKMDVARIAELCHQVIAFPLPRWRSLWNCLRALPTDKPLQGVYCWQPALAGKVVDLALPDGKPAFDIVHVEHLRGAAFGLHLKARLEAGNHQLPIVWDSVDCISYLFRQTTAASQSRFGSSVARFDLARTERYESFLARQFDHLLMVSEIDRQALLDLLPPGENQPPISVIPCGIDPDYFFPEYGAEREQATLVFTGKMSYHANVTMVRYLVQEIMPLVWQQRPEVKINIVGKDPPREVLSLAEQPGVAVTGTVPDIRPFLRRATIAVVPLVYGAGVQLKVLEAMACATPVVATSRAVLPLAFVPERDLLVGEDTTTFVGNVLKLLADVQQQRTIGEAGLAAVRRRYNWAAIAIHLEEIYHQLVL